MSADNRKWFSREEGNLTVIRFTTDPRKWVTTVENGLTVIRFI